MILKLIIAVLLLLLAALIVWGATEFPGDWEGDAE